MTKTINSFTHNTKYFLTIDDETGLVTDCGCPDQHFRCHVKGNAGYQCKHIREGNQEITKVLVFNELRRKYDSRLNGQAVSQRIYFEMALGY